MCSFFGQIAYGALMFFCLSLTVASLFSPGWYSNGKDTQHGIVVCKYDDSLNKTQNEEICKEWWNKQPSEIKAVIILMGAAIAIEIFALIWTLVSFCACCCRSYFLHILPTAATIITVLLVISMILFLIKHKEIKPYDKDETKLDNVSYSFWLGIGAILLAIAASIMGSITSCLSDKCC